MRIDVRRVHSTPDVPVVVVLVDGKRLRPERSQRLRNHSPDGFNCGYHGSGPAQLALAILLEYGCDDGMAMRHYQAFKNDHVARWPQVPGAFVVDVDIAVWLLRQEATWHQRK